MVHQQHIDPLSQLDPSRAYVLRYERGGWWAYGIPLRTVLQWLAYDGPYRLTEAGDFDG